jgi:hypothetical protein
MAALSRRPLISGGVGQGHVRIGELGVLVEPVIHAVVSVHVGEATATHEKKTTSKSKTTPMGKYGSLAPVPESPVSFRVLVAYTPAATRSGQTIRVEH